MIVGERGAMYELLFCSCLVCKESTMKTVVTAVSSVDGLVITVPNKDNECVT